MIFIDCCLKSNYIFIDSLNSLITVFHSGSCWYNTNSLSVPHDTVILKSNSV